MRNMMNRLKEECEEALIQPSEIEVFVWKLRKYRRSMVSSAGDLIQVGNRGSSTKELPRSRLNRKCKTDNICCSSSGKWTNQRLLLRRHWYKSGRLCCNHGQASGFPKSP